MRNIKKTKQTPHQRHQRQAREREKGRGRRGQKKLARKSIFFLWAQPGRQKIKSRISHLINFVRLSKRRMALPRWRRGSEKALKLHHQERGLVWGEWQGATDADGIDDVVVAVCSPVCCHHHLVLCRTVIKEVKNLDPINAAKSWKKGKAVRGRGAGQLGTVGRFGLLCVTAALTFILISARVQCGGN